MLHQLAESGEDITWQVHRVFNKLILLSGIYFKNQIEDQYRRNLLGFLLIAGNKERCIEL